MRMVHFFEIDQPRRSRLWTIWGAANRMSPSSTSAIARITTPPSSASRETTRACMRAIAYPKPDSPYRPPVPAASPAAGEWRLAQSVDYRSDEMQAAPGGAAGAARRYECQQLAPPQPLRELRVWLAQKHLDASVLRSTLLGAVVRDWLAFASALDRDAGRRNAAVSEIVTHASGTSKRKRVIHRG